VEWADVSGIPLGVGLGAESGYAEATLRLNQKDMVIFTSDGVVEATNAQGMLFGFERLEQAVAIGPKTSAAAMLTHLKLEVAAFTGQIEPRDDITILVLQI
jgi:serine phosphatase RsbU (regulator of sigma subunit)